MIPPLSNEYRQKKYFKLHSGALQENPVIAPGGYYIRKFGGSIFEVL